MLKCGNYGAMPLCGLRSEVRRWAGLRLVINFSAESEGVTVDDIVDRLLEITPTKEDELTSDARFQKIFAS